MTSEDKSAMYFLLLLILPGMRTQEVTTPSSLLGPRDYNYHHFNAVQFVKPKPTKKGPILFPNDAPPPPPTPLIVTSRPLSESIARSELNPNNSLTAQSQLNQVSYRPEYLARVKDYKPFQYTVATATPIYGYETTQKPQVDVNGIRADHFYSDYEKRLMATIHRRRHDENKNVKYLWDQPIHRRQAEQRTPKARLYNNARKSIFYDDDRSTAIKVWHRSLYSRETNDNTFSGQNHRRMNFDTSRCRYRELNFRKQYLNNNDRHINKRTHSHSPENLGNENDKYIKQVHTRSEDAISDVYSLKKENKHLHSLKNLSNHNYGHRKSRPTRREGTVSDEYYDRRTIKHLPIIENLSDLNKKRRWGHAYKENLSDNDRYVKRSHSHSIKNQSINNVKKSKWKLSNTEKNLIDIKLRGEYFYTIENQSGNDKKKTRWIFTNRSEHVTDNNDINNKHSHTVDTYRNANERNIKWRLLNRADDAIEDNDVNINKHSHSIEHLNSDNGKRDKELIHMHRAEYLNNNYDTEIKSKHSHSLENLSGYYDTIKSRRNSHRREDIYDSTERLRKWTPSHGSKNETSDNYDNIIERNQPHSIEDYGENKKKYDQRRPMFEAGAYRKDMDGKNHKQSIEEKYKIQPRNVQPLSPLNTLSDHHHGHGEHNTHQQPYRYNPQAHSPDYSNYYNTDERRHDASKEYNQGDNYAFSYKVKDHKTGDDFSHSQQSTGSATNGEYRVRLPDGRMQIVSYTADENGYKADVRYDDHHNINNNINIDTIDDRYRTVSPINYKNQYHTNQDYLYSRDIANSPDYLKRNNYKGDKSHEGYYNEYQTINPSVNNQDPPLHRNDVPNNDFLTDNNNDYLEHYKDKNTESNDKFDELTYTVKPAHKGYDSDFFHIADEIPASKEFVDYSSELNNGYQPHTSKFNAFINQETPKPTVKPSYEELKDLFVTNIYRRLQNRDSQVVSTVKPNYEATTENIILITAKKPNLYTNIRDAVTPSPLSYSNAHFASTPSGYLASTIANLKSQINLGSKPVLSKMYIDKINKYLSFK